MTETTAPPSIALLLLPESTPASLYGLQEVFGSVGLAWRDLTGEDTGVTPLEARIVANEPTGVKTAFGPVIVPDSGLDDFDLIITTDLTLDTSVSPRGRWPQEAAWLQRQFERGAMVCSVCTGAVLLAESGLLDGHTATTHWAAERLLRTHYPDVQVEPARILALAGAEQRLITSGGSASWEDLALYLIDRFRGRQEAVRIAKIFLFGDRSEGQLPFTAAPRRARAGTTTRWSASCSSGSPTTTTAAILSRN